MYSNAFNTQLNVSYARRHTFSKVTVAIFENYIQNIRGLEPRMRKIDLQQYVKLARHQEKQQLIKQQLLTTDIEIKRRLA